MNNLDLLSIGDATFDVYMSPTESETMCKVDTKDCVICFSYGDKIPVRNLEFSSGGNAANNSVGVSRLGIKVGLVSTLGDDKVGDMIVDKLTGENIDLTYVIRQQSSSSNYSTVINYSGERTIFVYHAPRSYEFPVQLPTTPWAYLTSMGESFMPFYNHFVDWLRKNTAIKLAFNPGSWQLRALNALNEVMSLTYVIFVNREEAQKLTGMESSEGREKELLVALSKLGPKVSIITDGNNGSYAYNGQRFLKAGVLPVDAYERTGAGDAFGSGCLAALIKGRELSEALLWGSVNSASVIGYVGPQKGLLRLEDMPVWLERCKSSNVKLEEI
jgi:sugar/nucleoside kinase (ribokinase family)